MSGATTYRRGGLGLECVRQWADLVNTVARADGTEEFVEAEDLAEEFTSTTFDPALDSWAIWFGSDLLGDGHISVREVMAARAIASSGTSPGWCADSPAFRCRCRTPAR